MRLHHYKISIIFYFLIIVSNLFSQSNDAEKMVDRLISKMTIKEKIGQMTQINIDLISAGELYNLDEPHRLDSAKLHRVIVQYGAGSILNAGGHAYSIVHWREIIEQIQHFALTKTRLKIPVLYGIDAIHGANYLMEGTLFPQPLGQAATFNTSLVKKAAEITAYETRACGIPWNFSPVLDLARQPLWSRVFETYGEDVLLAKSMGKAVIQGYQSPQPFYNVASCMKHFLGYSFPFTGKDRTSAYISEIQLREYFLPSFEEAIKSGSLSVMINSGDINGIPVHANKDILTNMLRNELKFTGVAVTDWEDIYKLVTIHHVAKDEKEAVKLAVDAGIDMAMVPNDFRFSDLLFELVNEGAVSEKRLNVSVRRILLMKHKMGLFTKPLALSRSSYPLVFSDSFVKIANKCAEESITLLKNDNDLLPLKSNSTILITGPASSSINLLNGAWSRTWQGDNSQWNSTGKLDLASALKTEFPNTTLYNTCTIDSIVTDEKQLLEMALRADVILFCAGEKPSTEKPGDIHDLNLSSAQTSAIKMLAKAGKPIVLILVQNRPQIVREVEPYCASVIMTYLPSENGSLPLAQILSGKINPSGRLPITYPRYTNSLLPYDRKYADELNTDFTTTAFNPQWEFGAGIGYSKIDYTDLMIKKHIKDSFEVAVNVSNKGKYKAKHVILLYVGDEVASITPSVKRLRYFVKTELAPNESKQVRMMICKADLAYVNKNNKWVTDPGYFLFSVGNLSERIYVE
jgi:beta-glucosidase